MKCPKCNGKGTVGYYDVDHFVDVECDRCHGSGEVSEVEMTNEEYLRSANVNDMARCIATKLLELARREYGIYDVVDYATIFEWLKEIHHAE